MAKSKKSSKKNASVKTSKPAVKDEEVKTEKTEKTEKVVKSEKPEKVEKKEEKKAEKTEKTEKEGFFGRLFERKFDANGKRIYNYEGGQVKFTFILI